MVLSRIEILSYLDYSKDYYMLIQFHIYTPNYCILFTSGRRPKLQREYRRDLAKELVQSAQGVPTVSRGRPSVAPQTLSRLRGRHFQERVRNIHGIVGSKICEVCGPARRTMDQDSDPQKRYVQYM